MYPGELLNLFPPFPRNNIVFVAMSFDPVFTPRWENVIEPAISSTEYNGKKLTGHRIDLTKQSDSIITAIVLNISQCRLVFADISTIGHLDIGSGKKRAIRNGNVLYELKTPYRDGTTHVILRAAGLHCPAYRLGPLAQGQSGSIP